MVNNEQTISEIEDVLDGFLIILKLHSPHLEYKIKKSNYKDSIIYKMSDNGNTNDFLLVVCLEKENIIVTINKNRFQNGIIFHYKLRNYEIESGYFDYTNLKYGKDYRFSNIPIWELKANNTKIIADVVNVINKKIK